ncbi:checkpoint protein Hus1/Mec3 [Gaertneriomyces semiglobifer]|nr:checkpoint protein Hus1/Mec3 [Gaertneriomyces semiglobifer]
MALSLDKLTKRAILHFSPDYLHFIVGKSHLMETVQMFGQIKQDRILENYTTTSYLANNIWIEICVQHLVKGLRSAQQASEVVWKLAKIDGMPCLSLRITTMSRTGTPMHLSHSIPIRVLHPSESNALTQPVLQSYNVHILLPPLTQLRSISERLTKLASRVTIKANLSGELKLAVEGEGVQVETGWTGLGVPELDPEHSSATPTPTLTHPTQFASVLIDIRDFVRFLGSSVICPRNVVCCLAESHGLILYVYLGEGTDADDGAFIYYIPARAV